MEAVCVATHLAPPGSPQAKQLCHVHAQLSPGQSHHRQNKSCIYVCRVALVISNSLQPCRLWPTRLLCQRVFRQKYWNLLANIGCHALLEHYISCCPSCQLPWVPSAASTPCNPSNCTTSTPGPHRDKPKSSRAASGANPSGWLHGEVEIKPQLKPRGSVAKEEDRKPSHQLYKLQIKSTLGTLCVYGIYKRSLRAPTKENTLVLVTVDIGGKNT